MVDDAARETGVSSPQEPVEQVAGGYFTRHWRGQMPLGVAFWGNTIGLSSLVVIPLFFVGATLIGSSQNEYLARAIVIPLVSLPATIVLVWAIVGMWRSARLYAGPRWRQAMARMGAVVLGAFFGLLWIGGPIQEVYKYFEARRITREFVSEPGFLGIIGDPYNEYGRRGLAYLHLGEFDLAIADFSAAIRFHPNDGWAYYQRGYVYVKSSRDFDRAFSDFKRASELGFSAADDMLKILQSHDLPAKGTSKTHDETRQSPPK